MLSSLGLFLVMLTGVLFIVLPRQHAAIPFLLGITFIPCGFISLAGTNFYPARILILFGTVRVASRSEYRGIKLNGIDTGMLLWALVAIITGFTLVGTTGEFIFRMGLAYDAVGSYFLLRFLMRTPEDLNKVLKIMALALVVMAVFMIYEHLRGHNLFSALGGIRPYPVIRDGRVRCQGPFTNSILCGTVAATCFGWYVALKWQGKAMKLFFYCGTIASAVIVILTASSGPIMSFAFTITALFAYRFRNKMKEIRNGIFGSLILLHIVMEAPVWFLMARVDLTGSSTGWHRAELIDSFFRHFHEWWLTGTSYTRHWMPTGVSWSPDHTDITNQYIKMGVWGGLPLMIVFIIVLIRAYKSLGYSLRCISDTNITHKMMVWGLGAALFSHTLTFLSVRYFDQSMFFYYILLVMISCLGDYWKANPQILQTQQYAFTNTQQS